jgi:hypothetical protein
VGNAVAYFGQFWFEGVSRRLGTKYPRKQAEYLRLPLACCGAPALFIALLWLGWTSTLEIHWIVPLLATIPYGLGYQMVMMAMTNYVADTYKTYAASALAACGATRSIVGALLPLAIGDMIDGLGIAWSCTVMAIASAVLGFVPFAFVIWGEKIRLASKIGLQLQNEGRGNSECSGGDGNAHTVV